jgi:hypothetical protein
MAAYRGSRSERLSNGPEKQRLYSFMSEISSLFPLIDYHKRDDLDKQTRDAVARLMIADLDNHQFVTDYPCLALNTVSAMLLAD